MNAPAMALANRRFLWRQVGPNRDNLASEAQSKRDRQGKHICVSPTSKQNSLDPFPDRNRIHHRPRHFFRPDQHP